MQIECIDNLRTSDSFMTNENDQEARNLAYTHLSKTEIIKHVLKPGTRGFAKYTIFNKDGMAKEGGRPNLVLLQGREFLAQKLSGVPQSSTVDHRDYEIRYFGFGKGGAQEGTSTVPNKMGPFDDDSGLYAPGHFASGASDRDSQFQYMHNGMLKRIKSNGGTIVIVEEDHVINKGQNTAGTNLDSSTTLTVSKYTAIKYTMYIESHEFIKPALEGAVSDLPYAFNECALYAVKMEKVLNDDGVTHMELPSGNSDLEKQAAPFITFARFTTSTKWIEEGDYLKIEWYILV